jgi:hypothetical protein
MLDKDNRPILYKNMPELSRFLGGKMLAYVIKAELRGDYKIYVEFNDGLSGIIDFKAKIATDHREIIRELVDKNKFNKIKVERHTVCWENGVDFAPEYLYDQIKIQQKIA